MTGTRRSVAIGFGRSVTIVCLALVLSAAWGCATVKSWDLLGQEDDFEDVYKKYTQSIRWSNFDKARAFVAQDSIDAFRAQIPALEDIRFTDYEVREADFELDRETATVRVTYRGYSIKSLVERSVEETQDWTIDPEQGRWVVRPDLTILRAGVVGTRP